MLRVQINETLVEKTVKETGLEPNQAVEAAIKDFLQARRKMKAYQREVAALRKQRETALVKP